MAEERRSARRARLAGVRATYESATGEQKDADVVDMSRAGLFLRSEAPLAPGKRLAVEIHVSGEPASWPALGRVVWTRTESAGGARPKGMAVKLIDVEDAVAESIDRLVQTREPTNRGVGTRRAVPRERTILGVGGSFSSEPPTPPAAPSAPPPSAAVPSEPATTPRLPSEPPTTPMLPSESPDSPRVASEPRAALGPGPGEVAASPHAPPATSEPGATAVDVDTPPPERRPEPTIAIDLVARKSEPAPSPTAIERAEAVVPAKTPESPPVANAPVPTRTPPPSVAVMASDQEPKPVRKRGRGMIVVALLVLVAVAAYVLRDQWLDTWYRVEDAITHALGR